MQELDENASRTKLEHFSTKTSQPGKQSYWMEDMPRGKEKCQKAKERGEGGEDINNEKNERKKGE